MVEVARGIRQTVRAVLMTAVGGPEVLEVAEVPDPEVSAEHDVLVRLPTRTRRSKLVR
jgi:hypothetical protein